jgi:sterol desaturase/sphingolipid hydroxylase (fatty acid hydroxylase superfamily)
MNTNILPNILTIISYLLIADLFFYLLHRVTHRIPVLKRNLHLTHHTAFDVVPNDICFINIKEQLLYLFIISSPLLIINVNIIEYAIVNIIIFCHQIYTHSEKEEPFMLPLFIDSNYHKYHHQIGGGNYSILFPIWDDFMKTRIKVPEKKVPEKKVPEKKVPEKKVPEKKVPEKKVPEKKVPEKKVP